MSESASKRTPNGLQIGSGLSETHRIALVEDLLVGDFPRVSSHIVRALVQAAYRSFDDAKIRDFVPLLVHRNLKNRLAIHPRPQNGDKAVPEVS